MLAFPLAAACCGHLWPYGETPWACASDLRAHQICARDLIVGAAKLKSTYIVVYEAGH